MMVSESLLQRLRDEFDVVIPKEREIYVKCPACHHRGMGEDGSGKSAPGHLGLNFGKNVGYCVRCGYGIGNLHRWLSKRNIESPRVAELSRQFDAFSMEDAPEIEPRVLTQRLELPNGVAPIDTADPACYPFAFNLYDKKVTPRELIENRVHYACTGRLAGYTVFPFYEDEELVYWQARKCWPDCKFDKINPGKDEAPLGKTYWLYGVDDAVIGGDLYLCEGSLDRITLHTFVKSHYGPHAYACSLQGVTIGLPSPGEHWICSQLGKILALEPRRTCVLFDGPKHASDRGAHGKAVLVAKLLQECGLDAYAGCLPHSDPNELADRYDLLAQATQPPSQDGWADQLNTALQETPLHL